MDKQESPAKNKRAPSTKAVVLDAETNEKLDSLVKRERDITHENSSHSRVIRQLIREQWKRINDGTDMKSMHTGQQATCSGVMSHFDAETRECLGEWHTQDDNHRDAIIKALIQQGTQEKRKHESARAATVTTVPAATKANGSA